MTADWQDFLPSSGRRSSSTDWRDYMDVSLDIPKPRSGLSGVSYNPGDYLDIDETQYLDEAGKPMWAKALSGVFGALNLAGGVAYAGVREAAETLGFAEDDDRTMWETYKDALAGEGFGDWMSEAWDIDENDEWWKRWGTTAAGLGADIFIDPTTYLTLGTSALAKSMLKPAIKSASDKVIRELASEGAEDVIESVALRQLNRMHADVVRDVAEKNGGVVTTDAVYAAMKASTDEGLQKFADDAAGELGSFARTLAGREFEQGIGVARVAGTGRQVRQVMEELIPDQELAKRVFRSLDREIRGGVRMGTRRIGFDISKGGGYTTRWADNLLEGVQRWRLGLREGASSHLARIRGKGGSQYQELLGQTRKGIGSSGTIAKTALDANQEMFIRFTRTLDEVGERLAGTTAKVAEARGVSKVGIENGRAKLAAAGLSDEQINLLSVAGVVGRGAEVGERYIVGPRTFTDVSKAQAFSAAMDKKGIVLKVREAAPTEPRVLAIIGTDAPQELKDQALAFARLYGDDAELAISSLRKAGMQRAEVGFMNRMLTPEAMRWRQLTGREVGVTDVTKGRTQFQSAATGDVKIFDELDDDDIMRNVYAGRPDGGMTVAEINARMREVYDIDFDYFETDLFKAHSSAIARAENIRMALELEEALASSGLIRATVAEAKQMDAAEYAEYLTKAMNFMVGAKTFPPNAVLELMAVQARGWYDNLPEHQVMADLNKTAGEAVAGMRSTQQALLAARDEVDKAEALVNKAKNKLDAADADLASMRLVEEMDAQRVSLKQAILDDATDTAATRKLLSDIENGRVSEKDIDNLIRRGKSYSKRITDYRAREVELDDAVREAEGLRSAFDDADRAVADATDELDAKLAENKAWDEAPGEEKVVGTEEYEVEVEVPGGDLVDVTDEAELGDAIRKMVDEAGDEPKIVKVAESDDGLGSVSLTVSKNRIGVTLKGVSIKGTAPETGKAIQAHSTAKAFGYDMELQEVKDIVDRGRINDFFELLRDEADISEIREKLAAPAKAASSSDDVVSGGTGMVEGLQSSRPKVIWRETFGVDELDEATGVAVDAVNRDLENPVSLLEGGTKKGVEKRTRDIVEVVKEGSAPHSADDIKAARSAVTKAKRARTTAEKKLKPVQDKLDALGAKQARAPKGLAEGDVNERTGQLLREFYNTNQELIAEKAARKKAAAKVAVNRKSRNEAAKELAEHSKKLREAQRTHKSAREEARKAIGARNRKREVLARREQRLNDLEDRLKLLEGTPEFQSVLAKELENIGENLAKGTRKSVDEATRRMHNIVTQLFKGIEKSAIETSGGIKKRIVAPDATDILKAVRENIASQTELVLRFDNAIVGSGTEVNLNNLINYLSSPNVKAVIDDFDDASKKYLWDLVDKAQSVRRNYTGALADAQDMGLQPVRFFGSDARSSKLPVTMLTDGEAKYYGPAGVINGLKNFTEVVQSKDVSSMLELQDAVLSLFKTYATVGRPGYGFDVRNAIGAWSNNRAAGVKVENEVIGRKIQKAGAKATQELDELIRTGAISITDEDVYFNKLIELVNKNYTDDFTHEVFSSPGEVWEYSLRRGVLDTRVADHAERRAAMTGAYNEGTIDVDAMLQQELVDAYRMDPSEANWQKIVDGPNKAAVFRAKTQTGKLQNNKWVQHKARVGEMVEHRFRIAAVLDGAERFGSKESGAMLSRSTHHDYADLTDFERRVAKRVLPFYVWMRRNIPAQLRYSMNRPGRVQNLFDLQAALADGLGDSTIDAELLPGWAESKGGFFGDLPGFLTPGGRSIIRLETPQLDVMEWVTNFKEGNALGGLQATASGMSPTIKFANDVSSLFGGPTLGTDYQVKPLSERPDDDTKAVLADFMIRAGFNFVAPARTVADTVYGVAAQATGSEFLAGYGYKEGDSSKTWTKLISGITGVPVSGVSDEQLERTASYVERERGQALSRWFEERYGPGVTGAGMLQHARETGRVREIDPSEVYGMSRDEARKAKLRRKYGLD